MRRAITGAAAAVALSIAVGVPTAAAASKAQPFTTKSLGAQVSNNENVYDVRGNPPGASVQIFKNNAKLTAGTATDTGYYGTGTVVSKDAYTLSKPNTKGIFTIKGTGRFVSGTGIYKHVKGSYKFTGTEDVKTGVISGTVIGTRSL